MYRYKEINFQIAIDSELLVILLQHVQKRRSKMKDKVPIYINKSQLKD